MSHVIVIQFVSLDGVTEAAPSDGKGVWRGADCLRETLRAYKGS